MFTSDVRVAVGVAVSAMCCSLLSLPQVADFGLHMLVQQDVGTVRQKRDGQHYFIRQRELVYQMSIISLGKASPSTIHNSSPRKEKSL